jgi:ribosomal-protein-alanine N-acetyltransferase
MKTLETQRLILRPFEEKDFHDFYEYAKNPNVGPNAGWEPHTNPEMSKEILKKFIESDEVWALVWKENNKVIGSVGLHNDYLRNAPDVKMLGYVLSQDYWGRGIMTEAAMAAIDYSFETMNILLLTIHHYANNLHSKRVIEKCGFVYEGTLRRCIQIYNGTIHDLVCYSLTREEWMSLRTASR